MAHFRAVCFNDGHVLYDLQDVYVCVKGVWWVSLFYVYCVLAGGWATVARVTVMCTVMQVGGLLLWKLQRAAVSAGGGRVQRLYHALQWTRKCSKILPLPSGCEYIHAHTCRETHFDVFDVWLWCIAWLVTFLLSWSVIPQSIVD